MPLPSLKAAISISFCNLTPGPCKQKKKKITKELSCIRQRHYHGDGDTTATNTKTTKFCSDQMLKVQDTSELVLGHEWYAKMHQ